jgi:hypothetical protein
MQYKKYIITPCKKLMIPLQTLYEKAFIHCINFNTNYLYWNSILKNILIIQALGMELNLYYSNKIIYIDFP